MKILHTMVTVLSVMWLSTGAAAIAADVVDFEGIDEGKALGSVSTPTNAVTFGVGASSSTLPAYVAGVGPPQSAFNPGDMLRTPHHAGAKFLTDEAHGPSVGYDYFMTFAKPVTTLALDLYCRTGEPTRIRPRFSMPGLESRRLWDLVEESKPGSDEGSGL